ncbi:MAG: helix-turn-helix domain-containing protein [Deltaproteobacteria bacterium]|nr:helix-turn-helix domain-containing protein [Deltaproteobacteria bacterium]
MITIGRRIREMRRIRGWTQEALEQKSGISRNFISLVENDRKGISYASIEKISEALGVSSSQLLRDDDYCPIPVINSAACGGWENFTDLNYPVGVADRYELSNTRDPNAFYVIAIGDSMVGGDIREGDLLLVEPAREVNSGDIVLARDPEQGVAIKKFFQREGRITLVSLNDKYPPLIPTPDERFRVFRITEQKRKL